QARLAVGLHCLARHFSLTGRNTFTHLPPPPFYIPIQEKPNRGQKLYEPQMTISLPNVMKVRFRRGTTELELEFAGNDVPEDQKQIVQELLASFASSLGQPSQMEETEAMAPMSTTRTVG